MSPKKEGPPKEEKPHKIKIEDLPEDATVSEEELKKIQGGLTTFSPTTTQLVSYYDILRLRSVLQG